MAIDLKTELEYDVWIETQVELLKASRLRDLDVTGLIEELEDLAKREKAACRSFVYQIILHKLLCDYWLTEAARNRNHWQAEIINFQFQLNDRLTTNIRNHLEDELNTIYCKVLKAAEAKTQIGNDSKDNYVKTMITTEEKSAAELAREQEIIENLNFPELCPYSLDEIIGE